MILEHGGDLSTRVLICPRCYYGEKEEEKMVFKANVSTPGWGEVNKDMMYLAIRQKGIRLRLTIPPCGGDRNLK